MTPRETVLKSLSAVGANKEALYYAKAFTKLGPGRFALLVIDPKCLSSVLKDSLINDLAFLADLDLFPALICPGHESELVFELSNRGIAHATCSGNTAGIASAAESRAFPVIRSKRKADVSSLPGILKNIHVEKYIFLHPSGGLARRGRRIEVLNLDEADLGVSGVKLTPGQKRLLSTIHMMSEKQMRQVTYVIASPLNLLAELFTTRGAGTLLRRAANIHVHSTLADVDSGKLKDSLERGFGKSLKAQYAEPNVDSMLLVEGYRGGAIIRKVSGTPYMSKFWVTRAAQGEGLGRDIWQAISARYPSLFWRSRRDNTFNTWYMQVCDGMHVKGDWRVFWTGVNIADLPRIVDAATTQPVDFET